MFFDHYKIKYVYSFAYLIYFLFWFLSKTFLNTIRKNNLVKSNMTEQLSIYFLVIKYDICTYNIYLISKLID